MRTRRRGAAVMVVMAITVLSAARGQAPPTAAKVDTEPLDLMAPDRYLVPSVLEAVRRVSLMATSDGVVRSQDAKAGATVREGQEIAQLDRGEASARLKIAHSEVKQAQAALDLATAQVKGTGDLTTTTGRATVAQAQAHLESAQARAELAQLALDHCSLRAPFGGKVLESPISDGQFVTKGTVIADLADVSSLRALVPVARAGATVGASITLNVEGQPVSGKIQALLPLPESLAVLRELASPLAAAWVVLPNTTGSLEPGQRVLSPALPTAPIATIPAHALLKYEERSKDKDKDKEKDAPQTIQVIRNEYVTNLKVHVLGNPVPDRVQVSGAFRPTDALIVSTSVPLLSGTLIRFSSGASAAVEAVSPNPAESGAAADVVQPRAGSRSSPIGAPGSALPKGKSSSTRPTGNPRPATTKPAGTPVPF